MPTYNAGCQTSKIICMSDIYVTNSEPVHHVLRKRAKINRKEKSISHMETWHTILPVIDRPYAHWLRTQGSLTLRIQERCDKFTVHNVQNCMASATYDEAILLGLPARQKIYTREVFLYADDLPVVYAHSVVTAQHLRGPWHALRHLGSRPLGELLFAHPLVQRSALHFHATRPNHPLYQRAINALNILPPKLWARRSLFILHRAPLLVTEIFLPDILNLKK